MTLILLASNKMVEWKSGLKPDFHSRISFAAGEFFISENEIIKLDPKCLHLVSEIVLSGGHLLGWGGEGG